MKPSLSILQIIGADPASVSALHCSQDLATPGSESVPLIRMHLPGNSAESEEPYSVPGGIDQVDLLEISSSEPRSSSIHQPVC